jgi:RTX calcium-binding nonapeptide repeat (4 copies)
LTRGEFKCGDIPDAVIDATRQYSCRAIDDLVFGQGGRDTLRGGNGKDELRGDDGDDFLSGQGGDDKLVGGQGRDTLRGGEGRDVLTGYSVLGVDERDILTGGSGPDTFVLGDTVGSHYLESGFATINDFDLNEGDTIRVHGDIDSYTLRKDLNFSGGSELDTSIYKGGNLIGVVKDNTFVFAELNFVSA